MNSPNFTSKLLVNNSAISLIIITNAITGDSKTGVFSPEIRIPFRPLSP
jgi:hypothetical protein